MITVWVVVIVIALAFALIAIVGVRPPGTRALPGRAARPQRPKRILFPFVSSALSSSALEAALRLAGAEGATLMPVFLARVPMNLPLQAPLPKQSGSALMLQEAIEQRAARHKVPVDARIVRGRDNRHALREAIAHCSYDRIVIAAAVTGCAGFNASDVAWLLENAPGEIVVLRAADTNHMVRVPAGPGADEADPVRPPHPAGRIARRGERVMASV
jgi:nucleotide-binding universal stress UspA family protein